MSKEQEVVIDPFVGSGSTVIAARNCGKYGIGFDVSEEYLRIARSRLSQCSLMGAKDFFLVKEDARGLVRRIPPNSVDLCITSPPYWDILERARTADGKSIRRYHEDEDNLGLIKDYREFIRELGKVFQQVFQVLKPWSYCIVNVMDIRKRSQFFMFHSDLSLELQKLGFILDDLIIWDRSHEYNNLRPLGYPHVFRVNKVHEYLLIFRKPEDGGKRANGKE